MPMRPGPMFAAPCQELGLRVLVMSEHLTGLVQTDQVDGRLRKVGADRDDRLQYARGGGTCRVDAMMGLFSYSRPSGP